MPRVILGKRHKARRRLARQQGYWMYYKGTKLPMPFRTKQAAEKYAKVTKQTKKDTKIIFGIRPIRLELKGLYHS